MSERKRVIEQVREKKERKGREKEEGKKQNIPNFPVCKSHSIVSRTSISGFMSHRFNIFTSVVNHHAQIMLRSCSIVSRTPFAGPEVRCKKVRLIFGEIRYTVFLRENIPYVSRNEGYRTKQEYVLAEYPLS